IARASTGIRTGVDVAGGTCDFGGCSTLSTTGAARVSVSFLGRGNGRVDLPVTSGTRGGRLGSISVIQTDYTYFF
ncbi:MAG: hypothetical protein KGL95_10900, partial [Patescibacteria group bacterium]|nr:hypothetical protein [Patescibacteria group bacterium]